MNPKIVLASGSPRRKELLTSAGVEFSVHAPDVDETPIRGERPNAMVARLSTLKARTAAQKVLGAGVSGDSFWVLAADTTVVSATGKNLGKPADVSEARKMIRALQGKKHRVFTGYTLLQIFGGKEKKKIVRTIGTDVFIKKMNADEIAAYVAQGESLDKAGAYAAQGFGMVLIEKISGSYTNVVGLPVAQVLADLKKLGWKP